MSSPDPSTSESAALTAALRAIRRKRGKKVRDVAAAMFISVMVVAIRRFDERLGDTLTQIEVGRLIATFRKAFDDLETDLISRAAEASDWLGGLAGKD